MSYKYRKYWFMTYGIKIHIYEENVIRPRAIIIKQIDFNQDRQDLHKELDKIILFL
jgi:hypothetical protein